MADRAKHAFGALENIDNAISSGKIDAYDILFVKDANGKPYVGWIDKDGNKVIVEEENDIIVVDGESLPEAGVSGKVYIFGDNGYFWNGSEFINLCKPTDVSSLEAQVSKLETEVIGKVDVVTVETMIETAIEKSNAVEVIEF